MTQILAFMYKNSNKGLYVNFLKYGYLVFKIFSICGEIWDSITYYLLEKPLKDNLAI